MNMPKIEIGARYLAADIYDVSDLQKIEVRVLGISQAATEHWLCERNDGRKTHLPTQALIHKLGRNIG